MMYVYAQSPDMSSADNDNFEFFTFEHIGNANGVFVYNGTR